MTVTQHDLDWYGRMVCMPIALLINFSLFQYLAVMYHKRHRQRYVKLLLFCGFASFVVIIPLAHPDNFIVTRLTKISEIMSVLTFLVQIAMIGRNINKKMRIRSLAAMSLAAELLTWIGIVVCIKDVIELAMHDGLGELDASDYVMEDIALVLVFFSRFYFASLTKGLRETLRTRKKEVLLYTLYVTHEYPFMALHYATGLDWEEIQALWNRITLAMCLLNTIQEKIRSSAQRTTRTTGSAGRTNSAGPSSAASDRDLATRSVAQIGQIWRASSKNLSMRKAIAVAPSGPTVSVRSRKRNEAEN
jgi:hypothetical protein